MNEVTKQVDRADLLRPFAGKWVVLSSDETRIISNGETLKEAIEKANDEIRGSVVALVPETNAGMIL